MRSTPQKKPPRLEEQNKATTFLEKEGGTSATSGDKADSNPQLEQKKEKASSPHPYPSRIHTDHMAATSAHFMELMHHLQLNIPFVEALTQIPKYAKYLKNLLTNKKKLEGMAP
ncbi:unnamed protein product [Linum trigynum]|uniref:Uncharacterized protein n=1 Tax=Linum trigynum TaxID=586398 RepID=A0AAV2CFN6_9ROSI